MKPILTKADLQDYKKQIERQKAVLEHSLIFNDQEKQDVIKYYDGIIALCERKERTNHIEVIEPTYL